MAYLVDDLIRDFRSDVFDRPDVDQDGNERDTLWSHADVMRYANSAAAQWAADTLAYRRSMEIELVAGQALYSLPFRVIEIVRAHYRFSAADRGRSLCVFNLDERVLTDDYGQYYLTSYDLANNVGTPRGVTFDDGTLSLRIYPAPNLISTPGPSLLDINAVVYPQTIRDGMPMPSSNEQDKHLFLTWMKKLAYEKQDADVTDLSRAKDFQREYEERVAVRKHEYDRTVRHAGIIASRW